MNSWPCTSGFERAEPSARPHRLPPGALRDYVRAVRFTQRYWSTRESCLAIAMLSACGDMAPAALPGALDGSTYDAGKSTPTAVATDAAGHRDAARDAQPAFVPEAADAAVGLEDAATSLPPGAAARPSAGCGATSPPPSGTYQLDVDGTTRSYIVALPKDYDPSRPYRLVFAWHGLGVTAAEVARPISAGGSGFFGLQAEAADDAIFVAGQGLPADLGLPGWPDTAGRDVAFAHALLDTLSARYCLDEARVFSVGMSYGAVMTNRLGCVLGDRLRGIAAMSGAGPALVGAPAPSCTGQLPVWLSHGTHDDVMPLSSGERSRDFWRSRNHCSSDSDPVDASPCVRYRGCDEGMTVTWCAFDGGHERPTFSPSAIWAFIAAF